MLGGSRRFDGITVEEIYLGIQLQSGRVHVLLPFSNDIHCKFRKNADGEWVLEVYEDLPEEVYYYIVDAIEEKVEEELNKHNYAMD